MGDLENIFSTGLRLVGPLVASFFGSPFERTT